MSKKLIIVGSGNAALCAGISALEKGATVKILEKANELENKGHKINYPSLPIGGGQIIINDIDKGISLGASDWRKDGIALGV